MNKVIHAYSLHSPPKKSKKKSSLRHQRCASELNDKMHICIITTSVNSNLAISGDIQKYRSEMFQLCAVSCLGSEIITWTRHPLGIFASSIRNLSLISRPPKNHLCLQGSMPSRSWICRFTFKTVSVVFTPILRSFVQFDRRNFSGISTPGCAAGSSSAPSVWSLLSSIRFVGTPRT